ncbi:MAG: LysM peptidoglycan-binding domain-containing protein, partial [Fidelibacterota bacterium]
LNIESLSEVSYEGEIPFTVNRRVERIISFFQTEGKKLFQKWLERSGKYEGLMRKILREEGLPEDMVYLALIESGFNPNAYSWAHAAGPWQFLSSTARLYGLKINWWIDERRDPEKSTRAAARYLKDLYSIFDDWHLTMAAYNSGRGRIKRALIWENASNFWELESIPNQTRNYIPSFIAAAIIAKNPAVFGFNPAYEAPLEYDTVTVGQSIDLEILAKCAGVSTDVLREMNPELRRWATPPDYPDYKLKIPGGRKGEFLKKLAALPQKDRLRWKRHRVRRGETLSNIARKYGVSVRAIAKANYIKNKNLIKAGSYLVIPVPSSRSYKYSSVSRSSRTIVKPDKTRGYKKAVYKVRRGDTLGHIAEYYRTRASKIRKWNGLRFGEYIYPGQKLVIWVPENFNLDLNPPVFSKGNYNNREIYRVKNGDTLGKIAGKYGVTIYDLLLWNNLTISDNIYPGQSLFVTPDKGNLEKFANRYTGVQKEVYTVKWGDTLWEIARYFNVSVDDLMKWNEFTGKRKIRPGDKLVIFFN